MSTTSDRAVELYKSAVEQQTKFTYFLMGLTAASIAFAVQITKDAHLSAHHYALGGAVALWLISLFSGLRYLQRRMLATHFNHEYLQFRVQVINGQFPNDQRASAIESDLSKASYDAAGRVAVWHTAQIGTLYLGTLLFVFWHILKMATSN